MNNNLNFSYLQPNTNSSKPNYNRPNNVKIIPQRNLEIEARIKRRYKTEYNPYGGMGMDGNSQEVLKQKHEEIEYMKYWEV